MKAMTIERAHARIYERLAVVGACWVWLGRAERGYGYTDLKQSDGRWKKHRVHRVVYEDLVGPIPPGLVLDHLCRNKLCALPTHLEAVDDRTNVLRGIGVTAQNARKTHCKNGHELNEANLYRGYRRHRECRTCSRERERRFRLAGEK